MVFVRFPKLHAIFLQQLVNLLRIVLGLLQLILIQKLLCTCQQSVLTGLALFHGILIQCVDGPVHHLALGLG